MTRPRVLLIGDVHLSDKPPTNCTEDYNDQIFAMLDECVEIAVRHQVSAVAFAGDIFHIKAANRTSHRTVQRMIEVVQRFVRFGVPVYLVIGNHDITNDRLDSVFETQPFGTLLQAGARLLWGWAPDEHGNPGDPLAGGLPVYGVPWQMDWSDAEDAFEDWRRVTGERGAPKSLIVTHAPLYPPGKELPWENVPASQVASWCGNTGDLYYGHVHPHHGVFSSGGVVFCNQGAISRGSLHEEDISREPAVTIWDPAFVGEEAFRRVPLASAAPADQVFRLAEAADREVYTSRMQRFLAEVGSSVVEVSSVEQVIAHVDGLDLSNGEKRLARDVLHMAASGELKS